MHTIDHIKAVQQKQQMQKQYYNHNNMNICDKNHHVLCTLIPRKWFNVLYVVSNNDLSIAYRSQ